MPKDFSLPLMLRDLDYTVNGTYVHDFLFRVCPPRPGLAILEPGCGSGKFGLSYALKGAQVLMLDIDPEVIEYACRLRASLEVLIGYPLNAGTSNSDLFNRLRGRREAPFDLVMNEGVPQHWSDDEKRQGCIDLMAQVTRPGGLVVIIGNNGLNSHEQEVDGSFQFQYMGMPPQRKCFTPEELKTRMELAGLREVRVEPLAGALLDATLIAGWGVK